MAQTSARQTSPHGTTYEFDVADVEYVRHETGPLLARVFRPRGAGPFPILLDIHGGAWCNGDRHNDTQLNEILARAGIIVVALDFRQPPTASYPGSIADINYAVRWAKTQAAKWSGRAGKVGVLGISSGGHQGMLAAMRPKDARYAAVPSGPLGSHDASIAAVVMLWPVIDPLGRYRYAKEMIAKGGAIPEQLPRVIPSHDTYWGSEAAMEEGAPTSILAKGEKVALPPVLYVQGRGDKVHPLPQLEAFVAAYKAAGGPVDLALYDGEDSGFVVRDTRNPANREDALQRIIAFTHKHLG